MKFVSTFMVLVARALLYLDKRAVADFVYRAVREVPGIVNAQESAGRISAAAKQLLPLVTVAQIKYGSKYNIREILTAAIKASDIFIDISAESIELLLQEITFAYDPEVASEQAADEGLASSAEVE